MIKIDKCMVVILVLRTAANDTVFGATHFSVHATSCSTCCFLSGCCRGCTREEEEERDRGIVNCKAMEEHKRCRVEAFSSKVQQQKIEWKK